jgi:hypothetical protein
MEHGLMQLAIADRRRTMRRRLAWLSVALPLCGIAVALAVDLPSFRQGQWDFKRSVTIVGQKQPAVQALQKCINPTDDIRSKWEALARQTCKFSPIKHAGNKYQYSAICSRNGVSTRMMSVITAQSDAAYDVVTESINGERRSIESLSAHRVGDCLQPASQAPAQAAPAS